MAAPRFTTQNTTTATSSTTTLEQSASIPITQTHGTLVLRAEPAEQRHIQWAEDVVDNEGMGKKSSKVCCIYHRPHAVDESSGDESSSDSSDDDSEGESDDGRARPVGGNKRSNGRKGRHEHGHDHDHKDQGNGKGKARARKRSPNAYEKVPKYNKKPLDGGENGS